MINRPRSKPRTPADGVTTPRTEGWLIRTLCPESPGCKSAITMLIYLYNYCDRYTMKRAMLGCVTPSTALDTGTFLGGTNAQQIYHENRRLPK
jgi:hypothetical protein